MSIDYIVRLAPLSNEVDVTATVPVDGSGDVDLFMPVWTPGSYLIREFSRHVLTIRAQSPDGRSVGIDKVAKNRWRVAAPGGASHVRVTYRLYAHEMSVRTNFVDADVALLNGAATFLTAERALGAPHEVRLECPEGWTTHTALDPVGAAPHHYRAPDFDTLVDSPIVAGRTVVGRFEAGGRCHQVVDAGDPSAWDSDRAARDVERIVATQHAFWRVVPYDRYVFLNVITESGGGLEHGASTVLMTGRWKTRTRKPYLEWLGLASHEFFHTWNIKRLRPKELGPFDYERENYSRALWVVEGITSYYGDLLVRRAGLCSDREYFDELGRQIDLVQTTPGRLLQPLSRASFDAWIKHYRPDENSPNAAMSYYTKGCVVAFLLDVEIRRATRNEHTLDDVMRQAYARFSGERGYDEAGFRALVSEVAGCDLGPWLARAIDSVEELDYASALDWLGLRLRGEDPPADRAPRAFLGVTTKNDAGRLVVTGVRRGTPAANAGVNVDDEILAIDEYRVRADQFEGRLEMYRAGTPVWLLIARRERLVRLPITPGETPRTLKLENDPSASGEQQERRRVWLEG